jgi:hypothetical protein
LFHKHNDHVFFIFFIDLKKGTLPATTNTEDNGIAKCDTPIFEKL